MLSYQSAGRLEELAIDTEEQWQALLDPLALDVYLLLEGIGPCSTVELSEHLGCPTIAVYPPLRQLLNALLIRQVGFEDDREGSFSVVDVRAERLVFSMPADPRTSAMRLAQLSRLFGERQMRAHTRAIERGWASGFAMDLPGSMSAKVGLLQPDEVRTVSEHLNAVNRIFEAARGPDRKALPGVELVSLAWAVGPMARPSPAQTDLDTDAAGNAAGAGLPA